jgi:hypothetical protein
LPEKVTINYEGHEYTFDIEPNEYFPTNESMYKVYLGFQNISHVQSASKHSTGIEVFVEELIKVNLFPYLKKSLRMNSN